MIDVVAFGRDDGGMRSVATGAVTNVVVFGRENAGSTSTGMGSAASSAMIDFVVFGRENAGSASAGMGVAATRHSSADARLSRIRMVYVFILISDSCRLSRTDDL